jgi:leucine dehydrogenase
MLFAAPDFDGHERVLFAHDPESGLKAIIAVHDTALGPACGGCRMWPYANGDEALRDVLRLSRGMSFKNAMAGLPLGGGKSVIIGDSRTAKTPALMRAFGDAVESLGGRYVAAEDVGISTADVQIMAERTRHVAGLPAGAGGSAADHDSGYGDPSPFTAYGVYLGIRAAVRHRLGSDTLKGVRVAVQGVGNVGSHLVARLVADGALVLIGDIHADAVARLQAAHGVTAVDPAGMAGADVDVYAPCALGGAISERTLETLRATIVAGGANNQLATAEMGEALRQRGVLYAPDYVINAGGIINVAAEVVGHYDRAAVLRQVEQIPETLAAIFRTADTEGSATAAVADRLAQHRLVQARLAAVRKQKVDGETAISRTAA